MDPIKIMWDEKFRWAYWAFKIIKKYEYWQKVISWWQGLIIWWFWRVKSRVKFFFERNKRNSMALRLNKRKIRRALRIRGIFFKIFRKLTNNKSVM